MSRKKWVLAGYNKQIAKELYGSSQFSEILSILLAERGFTDAQKAEQYVTCQAELCDPFSLLDMDKAVRRIEQALDQFERIAVYGDYDADGVTATALLYQYLSSREADVLYYIPEREGEGYGLHTSSIDALHEQGVSLIVTVDNGISAVEEVRYAASLGMDVVITDHHQPGDALPQAVAVVDPHRIDCPSPFKDFAGVGVAFKLVQALEGEDPSIALDQYADLICIGTIGDVVPLTGENRVLAGRGLKELSQGSRFGIQAMLDAAGLGGQELTGANVAFILAPRINAAGRVASPQLAARLLLAEDEEEAEGLALQIEDANRRRQQIEGEISLQVTEMLAKEPERALDRVIVLAGEGWHKGVIGIVASRLVEKYGRPCILLSIEGDTAQGSGRSIAGFSLYKALSQSSQHLLRFGGHTMAAGMNLKVDQIDAFRQAINRYAATIDPFPIPELKLDCRLKPSALSVEAIRDLCMLEPFGSGNPKPVFGLSSMRLDDAQPLGGGKHVKLSLSRDGRTVSAVQFRQEFDRFPYRTGEMLDVAVQLEENQFRGDISLSVFVKDIRHHGLDVSAYLEQKRIYECYRRGEQLEPQQWETLYPKRDQMAKMYRYLRTIGEFYGPCDILWNRLEGIHCATLLVGLDVFDEMGLLTHTLSGDDLEVSLCPTDQKVELNQSVILNQMKAMQK
nr:single-stranded-DNA-specific exonuclease RecJ [uncultured Solibaculum sp.]